MTSCVMEFLTVRAWLFAVLPTLMAWRFRRQRRPLRCYVIDHSRAAMALARASQWLTGVCVEVLHFRLVEMRDEQGLLLRFRIPAQDLLQVRAEILRELGIPSRMSREAAASHLPVFLSKGLTSTLLLERATLWRALQAIQVCAWKVKQDQLTVPVVCFLGRRPGMGVVARYGATYGVEVVPMPLPTDLRGLALRRIPLGVLRFLRACRFRWQRLCLAMRAGPLKSLVAGTVRNGGSLPRVAVPYYGHLNLAYPERFSDLFFWQQSNLPARQLLLTFEWSHDPLSEEQWAQLREQGMEAIALQPKATTVSTRPVFLPRGRIRPLSWERAPLTAWPAGYDGAWLRGAVRDYRLLREFWSECFATYGVKLYVTWFKYHAVHCAMTDALRAVGGITAIYQRAYESTPSVETTAAADVVFGFSPVSAVVERESGSVISYYVVVGYLGDHRFPLLRDHASRIRASLQRHGAQRIVAFTDENTAGDERWHTGHRFEQENYRFLLEKVLSEPWLGLVIKPKVPTTLRRRLGPVAVLLRRAEATGRCHVFEQGRLQGSYPPAAAALASDLMIHGHLNAGTAGIEAALAGVPTLMLDRLGWSVSPFYRLGRGRVVFTDWHTLWHACCEHFKRPGGIPGFGDWSPMLDELDPFRDGRAAERMGTYLCWLLEGFTAGLDRETVMADAAQRYAAQWGRHHVIQIDGAFPSAAALAQERGPVPSIPEGARV